MSVAPERKLELVKEAGLTPNDTGSPEVQNRDPHRADRQFDRAFQNAQKRQSLASRFAGDGVFASSFARLRQGQKSRALSSNLDQARFAPLVGRTYIKQGGAYVRRPFLQFGSQFL